MYVPKPLSEPAGSLASDLAAHAWQRRLTIYAGAGLSAAAPTSLPGAARLARLIHGALQHQVLLDAVASDDLLAVAAAISVQPMGSDLLRQTALRVADFRTAQPNFAHEALALLLCEGATTVVITNYDDCIERAAQPEQLVVVRTSQELLGASGATLLKAHGCATLPSSMLFTRDELDAAPAWATTHLAAQLHSDRVVFVGIGSPADYVKDSVADLLREVPGDHVVLVDPALATWDATPPSPWRAVLPDVVAAQRLVDGAEAFCDALLRAYLDRPRMSVRVAVSGMDVSHPQRRGAEQLIESLECLPGTTVLRWLRQASYRLQSGESAATSDHAVAGLLALGALVGGGRVEVGRRAGLIGVRQSTGAPLDDVCAPGAAGTAPEALLSPSEDGDAAAEVEAHALLVVCHNAALGTDAAREAERRVEQARSDGSIPPGAPVVVVSVGHVGPLPGETACIRGQRIADLVRARSDGRMPEDLVAEPSAEHLIDGTRRGTVLMVAGHNLIEAA